MQRGDGEWRQFLSTPAGKAAWASESKGNQEPSHIDPRGWKKYRKKYRASLFFGLSTLRSYLAKK